MTILVATPTWNRRNIVTLMATSLATSDLRHVDTDYLITDDASTEYSEKDLRIMFPWARIVKQYNKAS
jgi:hypothetical protein